MFLVLWLIVISFIILSTKCVSVDLGGKLLHAIAITGMIKFVLNWIKLPCASSHHWWRKEHSQKCSHDQDHNQDKLVHPWSAERERLWFTFFQVLLSRTILISSVVFYTVNHWVYFGRKNWVILAKIKEEGVAPSNVNKNSCNWWSELKTKGHRVNRNILSDRRVDRYLYGNKVSVVDSCHVENKPRLLLRPQLKLQYKPETHRNGTQIFK